jgi:hypothetical protein
VLIVHRHPELGAAVAAVVPRGVCHHLAGTTSSGMLRQNAFFWTKPARWERFEPCCVERSNPRADIVACARGPRQATIRFVCSIASAVPHPGFANPVPGFSRWRVFALDCTGTALQQLPLELVGVFPVPPQAVISLPVGWVRLSVTRPRPEGHTRVSSAAFSCRTLAA